MIAPILFLGGMVLTYFSGLFVRDAEVALLLALSGIVCMSIGAGLRGWFNIGERWM